MYVCMYVCMYIYIYIERERESWLNRNKELCWGLQGGFKFLQTVEEPSGFGREGPLGLLGAPARVWGPSGFRV